MNIAENIKTYRKRAGLTQKELAQKCKCATGTIQQYELGKRQPRIELLPDIATALGCQVNDLLSGSPKNNTAVPNIQSPDQEENFSDRLKRLRLFNHLTQNELAEKIGVSQNAVYNWENGKHEPDFDTLKQIADIFRVDADYLLGRSISDDSEIIPVDADFGKLTKHYRKLKKKKKRVAADRVQELTEIKRYTR